jgi:hypothetical protein
MDGWCHGELGKASQHSGLQMQQIHTIPAYKFGSQ